jgi:putative ABC transport system substrate-binding protein
MAAAPPAVILAPSSPEPFRLAAEGAKLALPGAVVLDPEAEHVKEQVGRAKVVVAVGQKALDVAKESVDKNPLVFCLVVGASHSSVGGNVLGVPLEADPAITFSRLKQLLPSAHRMGVIYDPKTSELVMDRATEAAKDQGLTLVLKSVPAAADVPSAAEALKGDVDVLWLPPNSKLFSREVFNYLLGFTAEHKLPMVGSLDVFADEGALASMSSDYRTIGLVAGKMAQEASSGRHPMAVQFVRGLLSVNLKTANSLGLSVTEDATKGARVIK